MNDRLEWCHARQRTYDIGIHLALGSGVGEVRRLVLRQGMWLALWGCALGLAGALAGTREPEGGERHRGVLIPECRLGG